MSISSLLVKGLKRGHWVWNENSNTLQFVSLIQEKKKEKQREIKHSHAINGLTYVTMKVDLKFKENVSELELMEFRHSLKIRNKDRSDSIVTIQDCKIVALFLCIQQLPTLFHKFFNLMSVNQLLRACIVYIQFYLQACETIVKTQHLLQTRSSSSNKTSTYNSMKEDLDDLRVLIGRFYAGIHSSKMSKTEEIILFECFLKVSTVVVWIALERKYFSVIKIELERIFRTRNFNNFEINDSENILNSIKKNNLVIIDGKISEFDKRKNRIPNRMASNSPIIHNFIRMDEPKLIMIERKDFDILRDERLKFLIQYIFTPETEIQEKGVSIGILGMHRRLFDPLLYPCSKRILKLLATGSPMDISEERRRLRDIAIKKSQRDSEAHSPHIFDDLPRIPKSKPLTEEPEQPVEETKVSQNLEEETEELEEEAEEEEEEEGEGEEEEDYDEAEDK